MLVNVNGSGGESNRRAERLEGGRGSEGSPSPRREGVKGLEKIRVSLNVACDWLRDNMTLGARDLRRPPGVLGTEPGSPREARDERLDLRRTTPPVLYETPREASTSARDVRTDFRRTFDDTADLRKGSMLSARE